MNTIADPDLVALDRFVSWIYWSDDDIALADALPEAIDAWTATAAAEHNESQPFSTAIRDDELAASVHELLAAVAQLNIGARPGLTVMRAVSEALVGWGRREDDRLAATNLLIDDGADDESNFSVPLNRAMKTLDDTGPTRL